MSTPVTYRFSFGPWNISEGGDPFGGDVRKAFPHEEKFALYRPLGFEGVQFHDDDVVPGMDDLKPDQIQKKATEVKAMLANQGLTPEFVAPRLWFADQTVDGAYTSNSASDRAYAWDRTKKCIDIANAVGSKAIVLWLAREGTYIREAKDGDRLERGVVLIAPGGKHMQLRKAGGQYFAVVADGPPVNRHKPSVDVLFKSAAECAGKDLLALILTGMGDDGARGMKLLHDKGARTIAQNEETCVVFGMPKEAIKLGAVDEVLPLGQMSAAIRAFDARG